MHAFSILTVLSLLVVSGCTRPTTTTGHQKPAAAADQRAAEEFSQRANEYAQLRDRLEQQLDPVPSNAGASLIAQRRDQLSAAVRENRKQAVEGAIFTPAAREYFAAIIGNEMRGPEGQPSRDAAKEGNPRYDSDSASKPVTVAVNTPYPETASVSSVSPTLLAQLPKLPDEMQFSFVGPDLILRDNKTGLMVDVFRAAAPQLGATRP